MSQQTAVTVEDSKSESLSKATVKPTENGQAKVKKALPNVKNLTITLNEDNWDDWNFEFRATLLLVDAVDVICGAKLTSSLEQTELFQWIYFVIVRSVNFRFRSMIQPVKVGDARAVYQLLFKHFVGDSEAKKSSLNEQFNNITLDKAQNFPLYAQQISNIADKLNDLGETVTEQRKRRTLLKGLKGRKYAVIRASIDFCGDMNYDSLFRRSSLTLSSIVLIILTRKKRTLSTVWKQSRTIFVELKILLVLVPKLLMNVLVAMIKVELEAVKKKNAFDATNMAILQMNAR